MKKNMLGMTFLILSCSTFASGVHIEKLSARGEKNISFRTIINPFGGALSEARSIAKEKLIQKCAAQFNGRIIGKIEYKTIRFDEGIMAARVRADGNCEYEKRSKSETFKQNKK
ncbi:MAG: hypothetical protein LEGION0403_FIIPPAGN_02808 [Legionella sp.]|uniref:hypothetical protein n=1 Tax=Legionella sp. TaxID=459 RepID=UPI003D12BB3D